MKLKDQVIEAFTLNPKPLHVNDIAAAIVKKYPNTPDTPDLLAQKISAMLSLEVKKPKSQSLFSKPKNKTGGLRKGIYKLRVGRKSVPKQFKVPEQPKVSSQFTGKAGEYAVMSELLFFGFNVSAMTVDDGIDLRRPPGFEQRLHLEMSPPPSARPDVRLGSILLKNSGRENLPRICARQCSRQRVSESPDDCRARRS